jgi:Zn-dependent membrane protease YugP
MPIPNFVIFDQSAWSVDFFDMRLRVGRLVELNKLVNRRRVVLVIASTSVAAHRVSSASNHQHRTLPLVRRSFLLLLARKGCCT